MAKLYTNEMWLRKRFVIDKKSPEDIAKECGVSLETIYVYLAKFGLRKSRQCHEVYLESWNQERRKAHRRP